MQTIAPIRKTVTLNATPETAFGVFTEGMSRWWNPQHSIGTEPLAAVVVEPRQGGRWYERGEHGAECDWGHVIVYDPPEQVVLAWQITADWTFDPDLLTEVHVRFTASGPSTTLVELEHRGLEALGDRAAAIREVFEGPAGWPGLLERFAGAVA